MVDASVPDFGPGLRVEQAFDAEIREHQDKAQHERERVKKEFEDKLFVGARRDEARKFANSLFKSDKLAEAALAYGRCLRLCEDETEKVVLHSNLAAVHLKQYRWADALRACAEVHAIDPTHAKSWYRRAQAHRGQKDADVALVVIAIAHQYAAQPSAELNALEANVRKDLARAESEWDEKRDAERRRQARTLEKLERERQRAKARQSAIEVPSAPMASDGAGDVDWSGWLRARLVTELTGHKPGQQMLIFDKDGWVHGVEVPSETCEVEACVQTTAEAARSLYYDIQLKQRCQVAAFRGSWDDPGAMSFEIIVSLSGIDCATAIDDWMVEIDYAVPCERPRTRRVRELMETPEYVPAYRSHVKQLVKGCLDELRERVAGGGEVELS
mmetsp:Transcript_18105/g.47729  ORF Transcript_18105/g.47729 Transcript_18105/m.47729 type:complete len:387 (+) Transcript_18105:24-1184(+)